MTVLVQPEKYNVDPTKFKNITDLSPSILDIPLEEAIKTSPEIITEGGKSALGTAGKVASGVGIGLSALSAYDEFKEGNVAEGVGDVVRMSYPWLSAAGPVGWLGMGANELIDLLT